MAGANAATSLSLTISVAVATLVVVTGILAGPTILDCARDGSKFGACLRDRVADSGLIAPEGETIEKPELVSETPPPLPPLVEEPPPPAGWIEANANEYAPRDPASVVLVAPKGALKLAGEAGVTPPPVVDVALVRRDGDISATVPEASATAPATAAITARAGDISATGRVTGPAALTVDVALAAPAGTLDASVGVPDAPDAALAEIVARTGDLSAAGNAAPEVTGSTEVALAGPTGDLSATGLAPMPVVPLPPVLLGPRGTVSAVGVGDTGVSLEASVSPSRVVAPARTSRLPPIAPRAVNGFDPQFPDVLVLPPPITGEESSFRTLQLN